MDEYNRTKKDDAPVATKRTIVKKLNPEPIFVSSMKTIATEKVDTSSGLLELPDGLIHAI